MTSINVRPRRRNSHRADETRRFPTHLQWIRGRSCLIEGRAGHVCEGKIEASHSDADGFKGCGLKSPDYHAVPLCSAAHREKDAIGRLTWEAKYGVNHADAGREYGRKSPKRALWIDIPGSPR